MSILPPLYGAAHPSCSGDPDGLFRAAYATLNNATNHYVSNTLNAKILSPDDDNFSDDELTFLPYHTMFTTTAARANPALIASLRRTWTCVRSLRSDLWNAIYAAMGLSVSRAAMCE